MGFRYRSSIRLGRGLRINLSKSGASPSVGRPGARVNLGQRGIRTTVVHQAGRFIGSIAERGGGFHATHVLAYNLTRVTNIMGVQPLLIAMRA